MPADTTLGIVENKTKRILREGGYAYGTWIMSMRTPSLVRMIAAAGFDFVFIDVEHSSFSWETVGDMCEMARACGIAPIVRPYSYEGELANRIQDLGAMGLMFHDVTGRETVDQLREWMLYPPRGRRGSTSLAAAMDYRSGPGDQVRALVDENAMLIIQIESQEGINNIDSILAGGGVDVVEIGRGDLSSSLGVPMQTRHELVLAAVDHIVQACVRHGVAAGVNCGSLDDAEDMRRRGVRCISFSNDRHILLRAYNETVTKLRASSDSPSGPRR